MLFFPTTLVCVDDEEKSLKALSRAITTTQTCLNIAYFNDPKKALTHILSHKVHPFKRLSKQMDKVMFSRNAGDTRFFGCIKAFIQNPNRYEAVSCVISDYEMPHMTGDILVSEVPDHIYKLMLTGVMDDEDAIAALNESEIDRFIRKNDKEEIMSADLAQILPRITDAFFTKQQFYPQNSFPDFNHVATALAKMHHMVECYLLCHQPPVVYLMIDAYGREKIIHFFRPDWTFRFGDAEKKGIDRSLAKKIRSGERGFCSFRFDPDRQPKDPKDAVLPLTSFSEYEDVADYLKSGVYTHPE